MWCWSANPLRVPLAVHLLPEGTAVLMINYVSCFSQPACVAFFQLSRGFVSTASYSELGQLSDARWPNSARPSLNSLRKGNTGKAVPLHCSCSRAAARRFSGGTAVTADSEAVAQLIICLFQGCKVTISEEQHSESPFCIASFPKIAFFACDNKCKASKNQGYTYIQ